MTDIYTGLIILFSGLAGVTFLDSVGSITSRKWNYNYTYLSPVSLLIYTLVGYFIHKYLESAVWTFLISSIIGLYEATVGWRLSTYLNANFGKFKEDFQKVPLSFTIILVIFVSGFFSFIGFLLGIWLN